MLGSLSKGNVAGPFVSVVRAADGEAAIAGGANRNLPVVW